MQTVERIPQLALVRERPWQYYLVDTILALVGSLIVTGIIYTSRLYPAIPNISIIYLLFIIPLSIFRGRYAAIVAAIVAFLSFDFFLVPPLYTFNMSNPGEWVALFIFLIIAVICSQLAGMARRRAEEANLREHQARVLYELMRVTNDAEQFADQLDVIVLSIIRVFSPWGARECALLLPDASGKLSVQADAPIRVDHFTLAPEEMAAAGDVMTRGELIERGSPVDTASSLRLIPLKVRNHVLGVLCLRVQQGSRLANLQQPGADDSRSAGRRSFFWDFLDQTTSLLERALLRKRLIFPNT